MDNTYYSKDTVAILSEFIHLFPLWSGVMLGDLSRYASDVSKTSSSDKHTRDTNARVESWFRIVKHDILQKRKLLKAGEFIRTMYKSLQGRLREQTYSTLGSVAANKKRKSDNKETLDEAQESWKMTAKDRRKSNAQSYYSSPKSLPTPRRKITQTGHRTEIKVPRNLPPDPASINQQTPATPQLPTMRRPARRREKKSQARSQRFSGKRTSITGHTLRNTMNSCWAISTLQALKHTIEVHSVSASKLVERKVSFSYLKLA